MDRGKVMLWGGVAVGAVMLIASANYTAAPKPVSTAAADLPHAEPWRPDPNPPAPVEPEPAWTYSTSVDPMTDKTARLACVTSTNVVRLDFPYEDVPAELCLRDHPKFGHDVIVRLQGRGQIICRSYDGCTVPVRFGKNPQQSFSAAGAADGSSEVIFITNRKRFEAGVSGADETLVGLQLYQAGQQVLSFPTKGFAWPKPAAAE